MEPSRLFFLVGTLLLHLLTPETFASTILNNGYSVRLWQTEDGLPQNMVTGSMQTTEGHIWFSTYSGLARFDGETFSVIDSTSEPAIPDRRVSAIFETPDRVVWIGHESGGVTAFSRGETRIVLPATGAFGDKIIGIGSDQRGQVWAMREKGTLTNLSNGEEVASLIPGTPPYQLYWSRGEDGSIWVCENGKAAFLSPSGLTELKLETPGNFTYVFGIAASRKGGAWIFCDHRVRRWKDGVWVEDRGKYPWPEGPVSCVRELEDGTLAVGTTHWGLYLVRPNGQGTTAFTIENGMPQNWVRFVSQDREGGIWVGLGTSGVARIQPSPFNTLNPPDRWQGSTVLAVNPINDDLWVGTDGSGLYHFSQNGWRRFTSDDGVNNLHIPAVGMTPEGTIYIGNFWLGSPYRLIKNRFERHPSLSENSSPVFSLLPGVAPDEIYAGTREGLMRLTSSSAELLIPSTSERLGPVCAIAIEASGIIWCGFEEGGLARYENGTVSRFHTGNSLTTNSIRCLYADDQGVLWIGTADRGIVRYKDGKFSPLGTDEGIVDNYVGKILEDDSGHLWLGTHHGLQRVAKAALDACAAGKQREVLSQIYNHYDGLPTIEMTGGLQTAASRDQKGRLWFSSNKGLISVSPQAVRNNPAPPPVMLESMIVDGTAVPLSEEGRKVSLNPSFERLEFRFSGLSFVAPEKVRFRYQLEGIDREWVDSATRRVAFYSRLPAGDYTFRVIACNNDNVWNMTGAAFTFSVLPFFWNTWWFTAGCLGLTGGLAAWLTLRVARKRARQRIEKILQEHAVELERKRIAQDIHDDIGSILSQIAMLSQPAPAELSTPGKPAAVLERIYSMAKEMTRSLDEIVWAVDPRHDSLEGLLVYMGKHAQGFLADARIRCRLHVPVELPSLVVTAETRHSLFLAFKEALNNAVKHSGASEIRISLQQTEQGFALEVKDDGRGFNLSTEEEAKASGNQVRNGLTNMQQRLVRIGGACSIESALGVGTTVKFTFRNQSVTTVPESARATQQI